MMGPRAQKNMLLAAAAFATLTTAYALGISVVTYIVTGSAHTLACWAIMVVIGVPLMVRLYRRAWRLIDAVNKDQGGQACRGSG